MARGIPDGLDPVNHWPGQSAALATAEPTAKNVSHMQHARALLA
jgi:hypothetical protein